MPTIPSDAATGDSVLATIWNQVLAALRYVAQSNVTGVIDIYYGATAPDGALLCSGKTIGNAASGGTARANADMETLFTHLWNETTNTEHVIQDSAGAGTTRGASAAADFAANKRMPLPDLRGRFPLGKDNMGGTAANRVTDAEADLLGGASGSEGGSHTHNMSVAGTDMAHGNYTYQTNSTSSSTALDWTNPYTTVQFIIWAGVDW